SGDPSLQDLLWLKRPWNGSAAYADSKLHDALLAFAVARRWRGVLSNAVEPGRGATKMGGPGAPGDLGAGAAAPARGGGGRRARIGRRASADSTSTTSDRVRLCLPFARSESRRSSSRNARKCPVSGFRTSRSRRDRVLDVERVNEAQALRERVPQ